MVKRTIVIVAVWLLAIWAAPSSAQVVITPAPIPSVSVGCVLQVQSISPTVWICGSAGSGTVTVTGTRTAGVITKFSSDGVITNSIISESGSTITVAGTLNATTALQVGGCSINTSGCLGNVVYVSTAPALTGTNFIGIPATAVTNTAVVLSGTQTITGVKTFSVQQVFSAGVQVTGGGANPGTFTGNATYGALITGVTASQCDFSVLRPDTNEAICLLTGTAQVKFTGDVIVDSGNEIRLDGSSSGDTHIREVAANNIRFTAGGNAVASFGVGGTNASEFFGGMTIGGGLNVSNDDVDIFVNSADYNIVTIGNAGSGASLDEGIVGVKKNGTYVAYMYGASVATYYGATWPTTASAANAYVADGGNISRSTSSARYKKNIETISLGDARRTVLALRGVTYEGVNPDDRPLPFAGLIAEEVATVNPLLVTFEKDGTTPNYVTYDRVVAYVIPVVQNHEARIAALEAMLKVAAPAQENLKALDTKRANDLKAYQAWQRTHKSAASETLERLAARDAAKEKARQAGGRGGGLNF